MELVFSQTPNYSENQQRFFDLLDRYPQYSSFWNRPSKELDMDRVNRALGTLSSGEGAFLKFLVNLWLGENRFGFDLLDDYASLDEPERQVIIDWCQNPFWP